MATNPGLDPALVDRAFRVSGESTKKAAVIRALHEFIAHREQRRVAELCGKLQWDASFPCKLSGSVGDEPVRAEAQIFPLWRVGNRIIQPEVL